MSKFYITTPLYYVNSNPHIGHSYTQIACDVVSRFLRRQGQDVFFITGTDEHGEKIEDAAIKAGFKKGEEKLFVDGIVPMFKDLWAALDIKYDYFIRTTDGYHIKTVQFVLDKLNKSGHIYKKAYKGWFCTPCETFWTETQSADGICPDCKRKLDVLNEENYFLKISEYQGWLVEYIKSRPDFIRPDFRRNEVLRFLKGPLTDLCISRPKARMSWGIEIPFDKNFVTYVWFDALLNYISGIGYPHDSARFRKYWPADFHVIGKDILRHHAVYWPIILHTLGEEPPRSIFAHGWWVIKGEKMSKSKGNVVDPKEMVSKYGIDPYRYFLLREISFGLDGAFSEEAFVTRYNSDLANDLGNLVSRTLTMVEKYFEGVIPSVIASAKQGQSPSAFAKASADRSGTVPVLPKHPNMSSLSEELKTKTSALSVGLAKAIPAFDFVTALSKIWEVINSANKLIEDSKPWVLFKEAKTDELASLMRLLLNALCVSAVSLYPFMPGTARNIFSQLGIEDDLQNLDFSQAALGMWPKSGTRIKKQPPLFPRI